MLNPPGIELKDISVKIPALEHPMFEGLNFEAPPGETTIMTGHSGTGKSTLLKIVMGFLKPDAGQVIIGGEPLNATNVWQIRRHMAYVPQEPRFGQGVVEEILKIPFQYKAAGGRAFEQAMALEVFDELLLDRSLMKAKLRDISSGERQRVAIALAFMLERKILVLDEPTSALDKKSRKAVSDALRKRSGITVLASSHDDTFLELADKVMDLSFKVRQNES